LHNNNNDDDSSIILWKSVILLCVKYNDDEDKHTQDVNMSMEAVVAAAAATNPAAIPSTVASGAKPQPGIDGEKLAI